MHERVREHNESLGHRDPNRVVIWVANLAYVLPPGQPQPKDNRGPDNGTWLHTLHCRKPSAETEAFLRQMEVDYPTQEGKMIALVY
jgi:hypothetical protein